MKKTIIISTLAGSAVLLTGLVAVAQDGGPSLRGEGMNRMLENVDTNKDGMIDKAEVDAKKASKFGEIDTNGDGVITGADIMAHREAERKKRMAERITARLDTNGDGTISEAEFLAAPDRMFDRADRNNDGVVDAEELEKAKKKMKKRMKDRDGRGDRLGRGER